VTEPFDRLSLALADRYRLEREVGQGGMATVYLAHDLKHDRKVAVKVLRPELAAVIGAERFLSEIKTTANLQHPHILPLFDSGAADSFLFYVMPFIEGESLRDRLNREKQLPIPDAVRIATEVASALDYAHRHNVIHRDIKPENVLLHDGQALVADFGIALAASKAGGSRMTETGMSLGTPHYMSPEQAMGQREITPRSDVYALGAMTYEMLLGEPPFTGPTPQSIVAKVMTEKPAPLIARRERIPPPVEDAVLTALEKLPADRFASAAEFASALAGVRTAGQAGGSTRRISAAPSFRGARRGVRPIALILVTLGLMAGAYWLGRRDRGRAAPPIYFGQSVKVTWDPGLEILPAISPDGKSVAYASGTTIDMRIYVRPVSGGRSIQLTDDTAGVQSHPRWSPDGTRILFLAAGGVFSAPAAGGPARPELPPGRPTPIISAAYAPDGKTIAYVIGDSLFLRSEDGTSRPLRSIFEPSACTWSPNGTLIACGSGNALAQTVGNGFGNISPSGIVVCRVSDGSLVRVSDSLSLNQSPVWSPDGRWLYFISNRHGPRDIYAQRLSGAGQPSGDPVRLTTGLGAHSISLSQDGKRLAYSSLTAESNIWSLALVGPFPVAGSTAIKVTKGSQSTESASISRDGKWLFYDSDLGGNMDLYRMSLASGIPERLTTDPSDDFAPEPSPDGHEVAFHSWRGRGSRDVYVMPLDGGPVQRVTNTPLQEATVAWSPDGNALAFIEFTATGAIWIVRRTNGVWGTPVRRLDHGFWPNWSPDGRALSFSSSILGGALGVVPVDSGPPRILMDGAHGIDADKAYWTANGTQLIFRGHDPRGRAAVFSIPAVGGTPRLLAVFEDPNISTVRGGWGFADGRMYYSAEERQSDVWVMEVERP
jgi:Tol biopolymer transport system component/tRNA A-37 threonylcarbamoyl transferase component Bud32